MNTKFLRAVNFTLRYEKVTYGIYESDLQKLDYFLDDPTQLTRNDAINLYWIVWKNLKLNRINSDLIAGKLFDSIAITSRWEASKCLQRVLFPGEEVMCDGVIGEHSIPFLNSKIEINENQVLSGFIAELLKISPENKSRIEDISF